MGSEREPSKAAMPPGIPAQDPGFAVYPGMETPRPSRSNVSVVSFNSRDIQLLAGLWQQVSSENLWQYSYTLGMGFGEAICLRGNIQRFSIPSRTRKVSRLTSSTKRVIGSGRAKKSHKFSKSTVQTFTKLLMQQKTELK